MTKPNKSALGDAFVDLITHKSPTTIDAYRKASADIAADQNAAFYAKRRDAREAAAARDTRKK